METDDDLCLMSSDKEVLQFYRELPFNYHLTLNDHVNDIRSKNSADNFPVIAPLINRKGSTVLEIGCGVGGLANSIAYHNHCQVTAIDFNNIAIERATKVASALKVDVNFHVQDLFTFDPITPADIAISLGVLHHTHDCIKGVKRMFNNFTKTGGYTLIGLYHKYGRMPFIEYFSSLKKEGAGEEEMLNQYRRLDSRHSDETHLRSWFRDQVLHPKESLHTLAEMMSVITECGMQLEATSINQFKPIASVEQLLEDEKNLVDIAKKHLERGEYFPGFFLILARKI